MPAAARSPQISNVTDASTFIYAGSQLYASGPPKVATTFSNFLGMAAPVALGTDGNTDIGGISASAAKLLGVGFVGPSSTFFNDTAGPAPTTGFLNRLTTATPPSGTGASEFPEQGCCDAAFLTATLNQLRTTQPTLLTPLPRGVTDARIYRVFVSNAAIGIHLDAAAPATPAPTASRSPRQPPLPTQSSVSSHPFRDAA